MNFKTTGFLLIMVLLVIGAIALYDAKSPSGPPTVPSPAPDVEREVEKDLVADFTDAVSITVQVGDQPEWRFARDTEKSTGPQNGWQMTAPMQCGATDWQVAQIATRIKGLKYHVSYSGDSSDMTAEQAGLDAPRAVITIVDDKDKKITIELGRNEGANESYVRLAGGKTVYRVHPSLKDLIKDKALDYREQQLFTVRADKIVEFQITERPKGGEPVTYKLVKMGPVWRFTEPTPAKTVSKEIRSLATSFTSLRAMQWIADDVTDFTAYGLDPAPLVVTALAEEKQEPPADAGSNGEAEPQTVTNTYKIAFSSITPLGEDTKVYFRFGDENAVATIMKTQADRFKPNLKTWRDDSLLEGDPSTARKITIQSGDAVTTLERAGTSWTVAETGATADSNQVRKFLDALRDTKAVNFEPGASADPAKFGLDSPRGSIAVAFDDDKQANIVFGGFTDERTQRLVYARVGDEDAAAKLHAGDAATLQPAPADFRDRTVAQVAEERLREIKLTQPVLTSSKTIAIISTNGAWRITSPVDAPVNDPQIKKLTALLGNFHGTRLIDVGPDAKPADFGLDNPAVQLSYTYEPQPIVHLDSDGATTVPAEPMTLTIAAASHDGKVYVQRGEVEDVIYEVDPSAWQTFTAEYRKPELYNIDAEKVTHVTFRDAQGTQGFEKSGGKWVYEPEADIPVTEQAVKNYVLRVRDLKLARVITYAAADLAQYGLDEPAYELCVAVGDDQKPSLQISEKADDQGAHYARFADSDSVFLLAPDTLTRIRIDLTEFENKI